MTASLSESLPVALDLRALAQQGLPLAGHVPLAQLVRLADGLPVLTDSAAILPDVHWQAEAEWRSAGPAALATEPLSRHQPAPQLWLRLCVQASVPQSCQRCLAPFVQALEVDRWFRFVADEATAQVEDDEAEEDLLVFQPRFDLCALVEDELLLALPLVPMHQACPTPVHLQADDADAGVEESKPNPFAALAALKGRSEPS